VIGVLGPEPTRRRARAVRPSRGGNYHRTCHGTREGNAASSWRDRCRPTPPFIPERRRRTVRCLRLHVSRPGRTFPLKALAFDTAVNTTLGLPMHPHQCRSRHRLRHRLAGQGERQQPRRGGAAGGEAGAVIRTPFKFTSPPCPMPSTDSLSSDALLARHLDEFGQSRSASARHARCLRADRKSHRRP
jgi:hypothetical protein